MTETIVRAMPVTQTGAVSRCMANPAHYRSYIPAAKYRTVSNVEVAEYAIRELEKARAADVEAHQSNTDAIAQNQAIVADVTAMMKAIGIPDTWTHRDDKSRARYTKMITEAAGYIGDLARHVPTDDGFAVATAIYKRLRQEYDRYLEQATRDDEQAKRLWDTEQRRKQEERKANIELATMILRYDLPHDAEWDDVLSALRSRDQRLDLAVAMSQTRSDWSEGFWRVRDALGRFVPSDAEDQAIYDDVAECCNDDCGDGRIFRDTEWSYGRLFASVADQQLSADVQVAMSRVDT